MTTSWDDGHPLDLRLARLLHARGLKGTFYVPLARGTEPILGPAGLGELRGLGMEIGAHTATHAVLTELGDDEVRRELRDGRARLEDLLGSPVTAFCYPRGRHDRRVRRLAAEAGYRLARTTEGFRCEAEFDPLAMPTSLHAHAHSRAVHARHALRYGNVAGLLAWTRAGLAVDLDTLAQRLLGQARRRAGVFHLWGHSWEIEAGIGWAALERLLDAASAVPGARHATNSGVMDAREGAAP